MDKTFNAANPLVRGARRCASPAAPLFTALENLFMPPVCVHCRERRWRGLPLCRACLRKLSPIRPSVCAICGLPACGETHEDWAFPFASTRFLFRMSQPLGSVIHGFKYRRMRRHIRFLGEYLRYRPDLLADARAFDALIPVPIHSTRKRDRGYNQAESIAVELERRTGVPQLPDVLRRLRPTLSQTKLDREARQKNLREAFACVNSEAVSRKRVLLVDDVFTTGATVSHCARLLLEAGCAEVGIFALAKVEADPSPDDFGRELEVAAGFMA